MTIDEPRVPVKHETILALEHVNLNAGDSWTDALSDFWFGIVGGSSDPRADAVCKRVKASGGSMKSLQWINIGLQQLHMPLGEPKDTVQVVRGEIGLSFGSSELEALQERLRQSEIAYTSAGGALCFCCPLGNALRVEACPGPRSWFGPAKVIQPDAAHALPGGPTAGLGIRYVHFDVPFGVAEGICRFYRHIFASEAHVARHEGRPTCVVPIGHHQALEFVEQLSDAPPLRPYDGMHIAIYVLNDFERAYCRAAGCQLVWNNPRFPNLTYDTLDDARRHHEFRLLRMADPVSGEALYDLGHEVRSLAHFGWLPDVGPAFPTRGTWRGSGLCLGLN